MNSRPASIFRNLARIITRTAIGVALVAASASAQTWDYSLHSSAFSQLPTTLPSLVGATSTTIAGIATDASGDVYLAMMSSNESQTSSWVSEIVAVDGQISSSSTTNSVILNDGITSLTGVAVDQQGNVYVTDRSAGVLEIAATNGQISMNSAVSALSSGWNAPSAVAVDANGVVYVADTGNHAVKKLVWLESSGIVHIRILANETISAGFSSPVGLALDASGNLYVSDKGQGYISMIAVVSRVVSSSSPVTRVSPYVTQIPGSIAVDPSGNILVLSGDYPQSTQIEEVVASQGSTGAYSPIVPIGLDLTDTPSMALYPDGSVLVANGGTTLAEIQRSVADFGTQTPGPAGTTMIIPYRFNTAGTLTGWQVLTQGAAGNDFNLIASGTTCSSAISYSAGESCNVAVQFTPQSPGVRTGALVFHAENSGIGIRYRGETVALKGTGSAAQVTYPGMRKGVTLASGLNHPAGLAIDGIGNIYVAETGNSAVEKVVAGSSQVVTVAGSLNEPGTVALDGAGNVYVGSAGDGSVTMIVSPNTQVPGFPSLFPNLPGGLYAEQALQIDSNGNAFMSGANKICVAGSSNGSPFSGGASCWEMDLPASVAASGAVTDAARDIFFTDADGGDVWEMASTYGQYPLISTMVKVASGFNKPSGIAVDAGGNLYVADTGNHAVKEILAVNGLVSAESKVVTLATGFTWPYGLVLDANGNLYVSDNGAGTVVEIPLASAPTLAFAAKTNVNETDSADGRLTVTITNSGNNGLVFPIPATGQNPSVSTGFVWDNASTCDQIGANAPLASVVNAGSSCTVAVEFRPSATGSISGSIMLSDTSINDANPGYPLTQSIPLSGIAIADPQTITFAAIELKEYADTSIELKATASSKLPVSFTSLTTKVCIVSGNRAELLTAGTCKVEAKQGGNDDFAPAKTVSQSFTVLHAEQKISFPAISTKEYAKESLTLKATATSKLMVTFSSLTPAVCSVTGEKASLLKAGTCTIKAAQRGNAVYEAATPITRSFPVLAAK